MQSILMREAAKVVASSCGVDLGERKLYALLRYARVLIGHTVEPYQRYRDYFVCRYITYPTAVGTGSRLQTEVKVPAGLDFLKRLVTDLQARGEFQQAINYMRKGVKSC